MSEMKVEKKPAKKRKIINKINLICSICKKSITKKLCFCNNLPFYEENIESIIKIQKLWRDYIKKSIFSNNLTDKEYEKIINGKHARKVWSKVIKKENNKITIQDYNKKCGNVFIKIAKIKLDLTNKRQSTLDVELVNKKLWELKKEFIYIITLNDYIMKIGGTRDGMKGRWSSYGCGYYVSQRKKKDGNPYLGKMSVTNAYLYHTIENSLIANKNNNWNIYVWDLPISKFTMNILGEDTIIIAQTYHAYETICIKKYKMFTGSLPLLSDNCDPNYK